MTGPWRDTNPVDDPEPRGLSYRPFKDSDITVGDLIPSAILVLFLIAIVVLV